jgi:hypothetical protein
LQAIALDAIDRQPLSPHNPLLFPAERGGYLDPTSAARSTRSSSPAAASRSSWEPRGPSITEVGGEPLEGQIFNVFTLRDGRIVRIDDYRHRSSRHRRGCGLALMPSVSSSED